jgi:uncharacterized protein YceK
MVRFNPSGYGEWYPAVQADISGMAWNSTYTKDDSPCLYFLGYTFLVLDMPVSAITDTVFLPVDIGVMIYKQQTTSKVIKQQK